MTFDDELARLGADVPGFGGLSRDAAGRVKVFLTDLSQASAARARIASFLAARQVAGDRIDFVRGGYEFTRLLDWRAQIENAQLPGFTFSDVDEANNRIRVGFTDAPSQGSARAALARLGIPASAVSVEMIAPFVATSGLQDLLRPMVSGLQIETSVGTCTLGYIALEEQSGVVDENSDRYLITASHCTYPIGQNMNAQVGQPDLSHYVGIEWSDPPVFTHAQNAACPGTRNCRYSDAAMFRLTSKDPSLSSFNQIAVSTASSPPPYLGNTAFVGRQVAFYVGQPMQKIGKTTGQTAGAVTSTCVNIPLSIRLQPGGPLLDTGVTFLCQMAADFGSGEGDSGGPVFYRANNWEWRVAGIQSAKSGNLSSFSYWNYAWSEISNDVLAHTGRQWQPAMGYPILQTSF